MFGYIVPCVPELKVREFERYREYYCGLCRTLKERYGKTTILNYDATFVYLLGDSLGEEDPVEQPARCAVHPFRKLPTLRSDAVQYAADINALMGHAKAEDDAKDHPSVATRMRSAMSRGLVKKATAWVPALAKATRRCIAGLDEIESSACSETDAAADPYGRLFGEVLSNLDLLQSHILTEIGYNIGRWVYLVDAFDDLASDEKSGSYNVYRARMRETGASLDEMRQQAAFGMHFTLSQASQALSRLELKRNREILDNIVRLGLFAQTRSVLAGEGRLRYESIRSPRRS